MTPNSGHRPRAITRALYAASAELDRAGSRVRALVLRVPLQPHNIDRQQDMREPRLDAVRRVLAHLIEHMDVMTLVVGRGADGKHYGVRVDTIAAALSMDQRRVERALHDLHNAGFIESRRRDERHADGSFTGKTAVRFFREEFFQLIGRGCAVLLAAARKKAYQARKGAADLADAAARSLRDVGRRWRESRPLPKAARELVAGFRPPPSTTA